MGAQFTGKEVVGWLRRNNLRAMAGWESDSIANENEFHKQKNPSLMTIKASEGQSIEPCELSLRCQPITKTITMVLECCMATKAMHFIATINSCT